MYAREQGLWEDAGFGWRVLATLIDSVVLFFLLVVMIAIAVATGSLELPDPSTTNPFDLAATEGLMPTWIYYATYLLLFAYYAILEGMAGASVGKLALGMRVRMDDGRPVTGVAVVIRNLIRIPEVFLYYIPSAIACVASKRHKRLGDFAAGTVVARRTARAPVYGGAPYGGGTQVPPTWSAPRSAPGAPPQTPAAGEMAGYAAPVTQSPGGALDLASTLARFKDAVLSAGGAHDTYRRLSEIELVREKSAAAGAQGEVAYSPEYVAAWYSLSDAVHALAAARVSAEAASAQAGTTLQAAIAGQPDLVYLTQRLAPYLAGNAGERLHEAYVEVVRSEARG